MKKILFLLPLLHAASTPIHAHVIIATTSFENETVAAQYIDTGDASVDHDLINNSGQSPVDSTVITELGYDASYVNSRGSIGLTDGDFVGVTSFTGTVGSFTDGSQGYQMSDMDGRMVLSRS